MPASAKRQPVVNAANTAFAFKQLIGWQFNDKEVQEDKSPSHWSVILMVNLNEGHRANLSYLTPRSFKFTPKADGCHSDPKISNLLYYSLR
jgi:molecular chaperone DnaK (HSP70)